MFSQRKCKGKSIMIHGIINNNWITSSHSCMRLFSKEIIICTQILIHNNIKQASYNRESHKELFYTSVNVHV